MFHAWMNVGSCKTEDIRIYIVKWQECFFVALEMIEEGVFTIYSPKKGNSEAFIKSTVKYKV